MRFNEPDARSWRDDSEASGFKRPHRPDSEFRVRKASFRLNPSLTFVNRKPSGEGIMSSMRARRPVLVTAFRNTMFLFLFIFANPFLAQGEEGVGVQLPSIASNFNTSIWLQKAPLPGPSPSEGAFRFICNPSHNRADDPILYPGQPGRSHMHTFFGNTSANAFSTYASLRKTGMSTCQGGPLNRSAYWMPAMMNGAGRIVMPDYIAVYYKGTPQSFWMPRGLKMIFGYDMARPGRPLGSNPDGWPERAMWYCGSNPTKTSTIPRNCPASAAINVQIASPSCWNPRDNLDSADHRSHMAYKRHTPRGYICPRTHPIELPQFSLHVVYSQGSNYEANNWYLASDRMPGMPSLAPGSSFHTDWFGAWEDDIMAKWVTFCIRGMKNCSASDYGDGTMGRQPGSFTWKAVPRLVGVPGENSPEDSKNLNHLVGPTHSEHSPSQHFDCPVSGVSSAHSNHGSGDSGCHP